MDLGTVFKLSLYGLTALVGAILGAAEGEGGASSRRQMELALPFASLPVVVCGYLFTERRQRGPQFFGTGLSSTWANVLGMIALMATGWEFTSQSKEGKLLAGTHLLLYATWIVLFQQKTVRLYWFLMALGILQLAVASVLTMKGWFGFCAVGYMFGAVWTLSIFSLWRAEQLFAEENRIRLPELEVPNDETLADSPVRLRLRSEVRGNVQHEDGAHWLTVRFVTGVLLTTCSALFVSAAFFAFIPRVWVGAEVPFNEEHESAPRSMRARSAAASIRLGQFGSILESMERVFEIQLTNVKTRKPISAQDYAAQLGMAEPLFRTGILLSYENGRWSGDDIPPSILKMGFGSIAIPEVQQEIRLEPGVSDVLYCLGKPQTIMDTGHQPFGEIDLTTGVSRRGIVSADNLPLTYFAFTQIPKRQPMHFRLDIPIDVRELFKRSRYLGRATELPAGLSQLRELAEQIIQTEKEHRQAAEALETPRELTPLETATAIEFYLRETGQYRYSLEMTVIDQNIDPIEDFLFNRKEGHCEYFNTALALMLRAANIPSRIVSGFKGGYVNLQKKDVLEVQQRFAHVWVEAIVDKDNRSWTTFDATPAEARMASIAAISAKKPSLWAGVQTTLSGLWSENVLNMSLARQEASIYKPMRELIYSLATSINQILTSPQSSIRDLLTFLSNRERWFSVSGGIFAFIFMVLLGVFSWLARLTVRRIRGWMETRAERLRYQRRHIVEFYERFVELTKLVGLKRLPHQTQLEFAEQVASVYSPELVADGLVQTPRLISQMFYKIRFGDEAMSAADLDQLTDLLTKLERALLNDSQIRVESSSHSKPQFRRT